MGHPRFEILVQQVRPRCTECISLSDLAAFVEAASDFSLSFESDFQRDTILHSITRDVRFQQAVEDVRLNHCVRKPSSQERDVANRVPSAPDPTELT